MSEFSLSLSSSLNMVSRLLVLLSLLRLCREGVCHLRTIEPLAAAFGRLDLTELQERQFEIKISDQPVTHGHSAVAGNNEVDPLAASMQLSDSICSCSSQ